MKTFRQKVIRETWLVAVLVSITAALAGCAQVRLLTYPPEFTYLDPASVKGVMHEMAISLGELDSLVKRSAQDSTDTRIQTSVLSGLQNIESLAASIGANNASSAEDGAPQAATNHLLIDEHIDDFMEQILRARMLAEQEPPNYYGVGQLTGTCNACHRMR